MGHYVLKGVHSKLHFPVEEWIYWLSFAFFGGGAFSLYCICLEVSQGKLDFDKILGAGESKIGGDIAYTDPKNHLRQFWP